MCLVTFFIIQQTELNMQTQPDYDSDTAWSDLLADGLDKVINDTAGEIYYNQSQIMLQKIVPLNWVIDGLFTENSVNFIVGSSGSGKTFVTLDMLVKALAGRSFANRFMATKLNSVLFVAGEGISGLQSRLLTIALNSQLSEQEYSAVANGLYTSQVMPNLIDKVKLIKFMSDSNRVQRGKLHDLVVFDTFSLLGVATEGKFDENNNGDAARLIDGLRALCNGLQYEAKDSKGQVITCYAAPIAKAVVVIHHKGKSTNDDSGRGASAIRANVDSLWTVDGQGSEVRTLRNVKYKEHSLNGLSYNESLPFELISKVEDNVYSAYLNWLQPEINSGSAAKMLTDNLSQWTDKVRQWLQGKNEVMRADIIEYLNNNGCGHNKAIEAFNHCRLQGLITDEVTMAKGAKKYKVAL